MGLLSDATVRQLCEDHLTCLLPEPVAARSRADGFVIANDFASEETRVPAGVSAAVERPPSPIARDIQYPACPPTRANLAAERMALRFSACCDELPAFASGIFGSDTQPHTTAWGCV